MLSLGKHPVIIHIHSRNAVGFVCSLLRKERESNQDNESLGSGNVSKEGAPDSLRITGCFPASLGS